MKMSALLCPLLLLVPTLLVLVLVMIIPTANGFSSTDVPPMMRRKKLALVTGKQAIQVGYVL